jgi:Cu/Ag efflux protein CusF
MFLLDTIIANMANAIQRLAQNKVEATAQSTQATQSVQDEKNTSEENAIPVLAS